MIVLCLYDYLLLKYFFPVKKNKSRKTLNLSYKTTQKNPKAQLQRVANVTHVRGCGKKCWNEHDKTKESGFQIRLIRQRYATSRPVSEGAWLSID